MRSFTIFSVLAALASTAFSIGIPGLPSCAGDCVTGFGNCGQLDYKCICADTALISGLACCVSGSCNAADQNKTITFADALCAGQGITDLPTSATCAPGQSPTPVGGSASSGSGTVSSASATGSSAASGSATSAASSSVASAEASASSAVESAGSSASATGSQAAASASASSEAKAQAVGGVGLGLLLAGLVAAL